MGVSYPIHGLILDYAKIYGKYNRRVQAFECIWE